MQKSRDLLKVKASSLAPTASSNNSAQKSSLPNSLKASYQHSENSKEYFNYSVEHFPLPNHTQTDMTSPYKRNYHISHPRDVNVHKKKLLERASNQQYRGSYSLRPGLFATEIDIGNVRKQVPEAEAITRQLQQVQGLETVNDVMENDRKEDGKRSPLDCRLAPIRPEVLNPSVREFRQYFKESERYSEFKHILDLEPNIYGKMNDKIQTERLMPRGMHLFQQTPDKLIANNLLGSDRYVDLFAQGLSSSHFQQLKTLQMRSNHLTSKRMNLLSSTLPSTLQELDLSNNALGIDGIQQICKYLSLKTTYLSVLVLEDNQIRDTGANLILKTLLESKTIKVLNLSKNLVSDHCMENLSQLLRKSFSLQELYLHYNQIRNAGGVVLFKALLKNQYLKVLDLSFNKLGSNAEFTQAVVEVLSKPHPELTHMDLSYNNLSNQDAQEFHKALVFNPYLYGLHIEGMSIQYAINSRGFLINIVEQEQLRQHQIMNHQRRTSQSVLSENGNSQYALKNRISKLDEHFQISDPRSFKRIQSVNCTNNFTKDHCWLCEGWVETRFVWYPGKSGRWAENPIFLHLDFDDWRPQLMIQDGKSFELLRMCPPNKKVRYFFSNPLMDLQLAAKDQKTIVLDELEPLRVEGVPLFYADGTVMFSSRISIVNYLATGQNKNVIDSAKHYIPTVSCRPREQEKIFDIDPNQAKNRIWSIENSIFKDFQPDTEGHLLDCFDFDCECGRLMKHIPNQDELEDLKQKVKGVYKHILACYHYFCAQTLNYEIPCINSANFVEFLSSTSILDKNLLNNIDLQLTFLSSYVVNKAENYQNIVDKCLVRFQFLEVIIRLAKEQYLRTGISTTIGDAVERLLTQDHVFHLITEFGISQDWRDTRYWTQLMECTIKFKLQVLQLLYEFTSRLTFKHQKCITLTDFKILVLESLDLSKHISEKEVYLIYLQSMQTQRDEIAESKHMEMQFLEFVEAIARLAEKLSPVSPMYLLRNPGPNKIQRKALPLFVKFEGLLWIMFTKLKSHLGPLQKFENQLNNLEKEVIGKSILKTVQARKLGVYEEDRSSDEEREKEAKPSLHQCLPEDELEDIESSRKSSQGWGRLRSLAKRSKGKTVNLESVNILKKVKTYQDEEVEMEQEIYEKASIYERMEIQQKRLKKKEFQKTVYYQEPKFKFQENPDE